jgi:hypothetical protein
VKLYECIKSFIEGYQLSIVKKQVVLQPPAAFGDSIPGKILITGLSSSRIAGGRRLHEPLVGGG